MVWRLVGQWFLLKALCWQAGGLLLLRDFSNGLDIPVGAYMADTFPTSRARSGLPAWSASRSAMY